ncbi:FMN-dependent NADH-azoreductase [Streptomyces sp. NPDC020490]|uniref:FMN-dependent NADH-azoreductase n=1 Tax=Streptomyces sp. NPDC020490 TaxID=3365078 RepID=UPI0037B567BF
MHRLLHIAASPRGTASQSRFLADVFTDSYREAHPDADVDLFNLWDGTLPSFGPTATAAHMALLAGSRPQGAPARAWAALRETFDRFDSYDRYVFSVPMWNGGIPYILKQFIDVISQPGLVFEIHPERGCTGLLRGKKAAVVYTSAGYGPGRDDAFGNDFQTAFFDDWLRWTGIDDVTAVHFRTHPTAPGGIEDRRAAAASARQAARTF